MDGKAELELMRKWLDLTSLNQAESHRQRLVISSTLRHFYFCIKCEWLKKSPIQQITKPKIDIKVTEILTVEEAGR